jgi:ABC-type sugar transport system ATPase subunit
MIEVKNIIKKYGNEVVLDGIDFSIEVNRTLSIIGKSGSGKTTLLKILAGMETAESGGFYFRGEDMFSVVPQKRQTVYISQEPLLFPHLNVLSNLCFGLEIQNIAKSIRIEAAEKLSDQLGLSQHLGKMPHQLSGGQKQRVAFGRAIIIKPRLLLLDEPFGSLDVHTRFEMQNLYKNLCKDNEISSILVTHDIKEALIMGNKIAIMKNGTLRLFKDIQEFAQSPESGFQEELNFWTKISN